MRTLNSRLMKTGYVAAGLVAGAVLATTLSSQAAAPTPTPTSSSSATTTEPHPGDNGADGVQESKEVHGGGHGGALNLSGTVKTLGTSSVTIKTSAGSTTYSVPITSDIDKNGEAALSNLAVGDAATFSVDSSNVKQIDKLHAGDVAKDMPQGEPSGSTSPSGT